MRTFLSATILLIACAACGGDGGPSGVPDDGSAFRPSADTSLAGAWSFSRVEIPASVTVTVTGDLVLQSQGEAVIAGRLVGECVGIEVQGSGPLTVSGQIRNACSDRAGQGAPGIRLRGQGPLRLAGAQITSSGPVEIVQGAVLGSRVPDAGCTIHDATIGPEPAVASSGGPGASGAAGADVVVLCGGDIELSGFTVSTQSGGAGGNAEVSAAQQARAEAGTGGRGGSASVTAGGMIDVTGLVLFQTGSGGGGGDAIAGGLADPARAATAIATGGAGGEAGRALLRAMMPIRVGVAVDMVIGGGGDGGDATAHAADGFPANGAPSQGGGDARAVGGPGGRVPDQPAVEAPAVEGPSGISVRAGDGGAGGDALAKAGRGGSGGPAFPDGGHGGRIEARGGDGGDASARDLAGQPQGRGGDGGLAVLQGGEGGPGASACRIPGIEGQIAETAGMGGAGGDAVGGAGAAGEGLTPGQAGAVLVQMAANGGWGGHGVPPGAGGAAGNDEVESAGERIVIEPSFDPGEPGQACPPTAGFPVSVRIIVAPGGDPAGHDPEIFDAPREDPSEPGGQGGGKRIQLLVVLIGQDRILIQGPNPWVAVAGTIDTDGRFVATGSGTVKGIPDSSVELEGVFLPVVLNGFYTMTPQGEPPITYQILP